MNELEKLRLEINDIDDTILSSISKRMGIVEKIFYYKKKNKLGIVHEDRKDEIYKRWMKKHINLDKYFLRRFLELIHIESLIKQFKKI